MAASSRCVRAFSVTFAVARIWFASDLSAQSRNARSRLTDTSAFGSEWILSRNFSSELDRGGYASRKIWEQNRCRRVAYEGMMLPLKLGEGLGAPLQILRLGAHPGDIEIG